MEQLSSSKRCHWRRWATVVVLLLTAFTVQTPLVAHSDHLRWQWPTGHPAAITRPFDPPAKDWLSGHRGVDLAANTADPVYASVSGTVIYAGTLAGRGVVSIQQGIFRSSVEPVTPIVAVGDHVEAGQVIGTLEVPSVAGYDHDGLHWGVRKNDVYVDPIALLVGPIVLKPDTDKLSSQTERTGIDRNDLCSDTFQARG